MRCLGIDYGHRRIGVAISDAAGMLARPLKALPRQGNPRQVAAALAAEIVTLAGESDGLSAVVIGLPRRLSGDDSDQTQVVREVSDALKSLVEVPVILQDERLTSVEAESRLARSEKDWKKRKQQLDAVAAAVILQDYLDGLPRHSTSSDEPEGDHLE